MSATNPSGPVQLSAAFAVVAGLSLGACSSGGGDGPTAGIDRGGAEVSTVAMGKITAFGSVVVNGVHWSTDDAEILIDGGVAFESDLAVGQVVRIQGTRSSDTEGAARRIEADDLLEGTIQALDTAAGRLTVLGQEVVVDAATIFAPPIEPRSLDGLAPGQFVEISGFLGSGGVVRATHIELDDDDDDDSEITGVVSNLDTGALIFEINGLGVDYSSASLIELPGGMPVEGMLIEVEGTYDAAAGVLLASELESDDFFADIEIDDDAEVDIEGLVTRFDSAQDFDVAGVPVTTTAQTEFDDGTAADLAEGVLVEVEGRLNDDGVVVAAEIEFEDQEISGELAGVSDDDYVCPPSPVAGAGAEIESNMSVEGVCTLDNVTVRGQVTVQEGAELRAVDSRIDADLQSLSAAVVDVENTSVGGNVDIKETSTRLTLLDVSSEHNIQLEKNRGQIRVESFSAGQDFQIKESVADIVVTGEAGQNAQIEKNQGGALTLDVTVGQDAQVKENEFSGASDVTVTGGDQAQCLDNNFDVHAASFESVDGCVAL